ncbi:MAG: M15 family metallopeptidase, partial [Pseudomonadota bacterium]
MRYLPSILIVLAVLAAPFLWHLSAPWFAEDDDAAQLALDADFAALTARLAALEQSHSVLQQRVDELEVRRPEPAERVGSVAPIGNAGPVRNDALADTFAQVVLLGDRRGFNEGLTIATPNFLTEFLGKPAETLTDDCGEMTNPNLSGMLRLEDVGPIRARMLEPALVSLRQVFANVQVFEPELYARIKSAGSLCVRQIRGTTGRVSNHSYGLAVDLNIDGVLDTLGDGKTQLGLMILSEFFRKEGWIWGAAFSREDSM